MTTPRPRLNLTSPLLTHGLVLLLFVALTAVMTWPLVTMFDRAVLGPPGDNLEYVWKMWWFKEALLERHVSPFFVPEVFYPFGYPLALSDTTMLHTLLGVPLTAWGGEIVAYNAMMYTSFVVSGFALTLLLRTLGCGMVGGVIGGIAFAYCPYRLSHLGAGHMPMMGTGWLPLLLLALERLIRRPSWRWGVAAGVFWALFALSSWYYAFMGAMFGALYLLLRARPWKSWLWRAVLWRALLAGGVVAALVVAPAAWPMLQLYAQGEARYEFSLRYIDQWSASPLDLLYPNAMHPLWGAALSDAYYQNINENLLYLGWVALGLTSLGWRVWRQERAARAFLALGAVALVLALGTTLHYAGQTVYLRVPEGVEVQFSRVMYILTGKLALHRADYGTLRRAGAIPIPLPTLLLYLYVPFMSAMRVWTRFGLVTMLSVAVLAGWGAQWLWQRAGRYRGVAIAGVAALLLLDFAVLPYPYGYTVVRAQPVDAWLAAQSKPSPVIHYPLDKTWFGWMLYAARVHGQPIAYGYGTFAPRPYRQAQERLLRFPAAESVALLKEWGVRYIAVGSRSYGEAWPALEQALRENATLEEVGVFRDQPLYHGDRLLYRIKPTADVPSTELVSGAYRAFLDDKVHVYAIR